VIRVRRNAPGALVLACALVSSRAGAEGTAWNSGTAAELVRQGQEHVRKGDEPLAMRRFADAIKLVAWVAGGFVFVGLLMSLLLPKNAARLESEGYSPPHSHEDAPNKE